MPKTLIIDSSYLIFRSFFAYPELTYKEQPVGAFFGFAKTVLSLLKEHNPDCLIFAKDLPEPTWRHKQKQDYKAGRPDPDPAMISQFPLIYNWTDKITKNCLAKSGYEADDIIFTTALQRLSTTKEFEQIEAKKSKDSDLFGFDKDLATDISLTELQSIKAKEENEVFVFSSDKDLYQLFVLPRVNFILSKPRGQVEIFDRVKFGYKYELEPIQWVDYKALVGDNSDNLSGVNGIGPKTATKILHQVGNLHNLFELLGDSQANFARSQFQLSEDSIKKAQKFVKDPKNQNLIQKIKENKQDLLSTYYLASLQIVPDINVQTNSLNLENGLDDFQKFGFQSLINQVKKMSLPEVVQESLF